MRKIPWILPGLVIIASMLACFGQDEAALTLKQIMADPDWIGNAPERPYWSDDGKTIYYEQKRTGSDVRDLFRMPRDGGLAEVVTDSERASIDFRSGGFDSTYRRKLFARNGDLYLKELPTGTVRPLTRTRGAEQSPRFLADEQSLQFRRDGQIWIRELETGLEWQPAELKEADAPKDDEDAKKEKAEKRSFVAKEQEALFESLQKRKERKEEAKKVKDARRDADSTRVPEPIYLGAKRSIRQRILSPSTKWMALRTVAKDSEKSGGRDHMPRWMTDDGYVEDAEVRSLVGTGKRSSEALVLIDLNARKQYTVDLSVLEGINEDPLAFLKESDEDAEDEDKEEDDEKEEKDSIRPVTIRSMAFSHDSQYVLCQCFSQDNKDRWIVVWKLGEAPELVFQEHLRDEAWINGRFAQASWVRGQPTVLFLSEKTGYSHLYRWRVGEDASVALTSGEFEVSRWQLDRSGEHVYCVSNQEHPGIYEIHRVHLVGGTFERLTQWQGKCDFSLSPNGDHLLVTASKINRPPELFVQHVDDPETWTQRTQTVSEAFTSIPWIVPEIVDVPSRHGRPIQSKIYKPTTPTNTPKPAVVFVHGAGYLQNSHYGWSSSYFREFMFHTLLVQRGYVVLDMDYRASAGYGRDWRTAIYRHMGKPELEDLEDGVAWLTKEHHIDSKRVGVYGGSYGGFMTLYALFQSPDLFACGAALRPVTDWAHYNHGYTSNILNTPEIDPEAYRRSSPIYFAENLTKPLLLCHGMVDDNVFFKDTVRLAQRLIELEKEDWEVAIYPLEPHGFRTPSSWLDEYRRILKLFEAHLK